MWKKILFTMWFQDFVTDFNQSYNCQTSHCLGRNRPPNARLSVLSWVLDMYLLSQQEYGDDQSSTYYMFRRPWDYWHILIGITSITFNFYLSIQTCLRPQLAKKGFQFSRKWNVNLLTKFLSSYWFFFWS